MFSKLKLGLVAAAVAFFLMPNVSEAQWRRGWGGYRSGFRGGYWARPAVGVGVGVGRVGLGVATGFGYGYPGYWNRGYYGGGYYGGGFYGGLGYYNRGYYSPGYYSSGYYSSPTYYSDGSYYSSPSVVYNSSTPYGEIIQAGAIVPQDGQIFAGGMATSFSTPANTASITVKVPANATLWWNGSPTSLGGATRYFRTSSLGNDGATQTFRARWSDSAGQQMDLTREVRVMANGEATIDFMNPNNANPLNQ